MAHFNVTILNFKKCSKKTQKRQDINSILGILYDIGSSYKEYPEGPTFWKSGYKSEYGKFFMNWYSEKLIEHGRNILEIAREAFPTTRLSAKISGFHWQYLNNTRCAEATAGDYNTNGHEGYSEIAKMFKENDTDFCFTCLEMKGQDKESASDPESLVYEVFQSALKYGLNFEGENAIERYDWDAYKQVLSWASKGLNEFTFLRMTGKLMDDHRTWKDFVKFTKMMHEGGYEEEDDEEEEEEENYNELIILY